MNIAQIRQRLLEGLVIPACPLPLHPDRTWSQRHQRGLARYYLAAGAGGVAVGVHSTQFAIRDPSFDLFEPVLDTMSSELNGDGQRPVKIAGICGSIEQAEREARIAQRLGYDCGLLSMTALKGQPEDRILEHCAEVARIIPIMGFYLQPAVGGQVLSFRFWAQFAQIEQVVAIKIAPFNRYQTLDVVRAVIESGRDDIALYTGNDDNIIIDLLTPFEGWVNGRKKQRHIDGGLLGQWGVWTRRAVEMLEEIKQARLQATIDSNWLSRNAALTDANAALFDAANNYAGCIPGIMEVLRRVGLSPSAACLDPDEKLSEGQAAELDRVTGCYPELIDDAFVGDNLDAWLN